MYIYIYIYIYIYTYAGISEAGWATGPLREGLVIFRILCYQLLYKSIITYDNYKYINNHTYMYVYMKHELYI